MVEGRLLFEKVKWGPGSQASNEMESLDYPQMEKGDLTDQAFKAVGRVSATGLHFLRQVGLGSGTTGLYEIIC